MDSLKRGSGHPTERALVGEQQKVHSSLPMDLKRGAIPSLKADQADQLEVRRAPGVAPPRPERMALFNDFVTQLPKMDSEDRDAAFKILSQRLDAADLDAVSTSAFVPSVETPESAFQPEKVIRLGAIPEMLTTEQTHYEALKAFDSLLSDKSFQSGLSSSDKKWLTAALPALKDSLAVSSQLLYLFHMATGTKPGTDVVQAFREMTADQRRAASENMLRAFNSPVFKISFSKAASNMNKFFDGWESFANRNSALIRAKAEWMNLSDRVKPFGFNPSIPMVQRGPRYELLLKDASRVLPSSFQPLAQAATLRAKQVATQINENQKPQGFFSRVLSWFGWR